MSPEEPVVITAEHVKQAAINIRERDAVDSDYARELRMKIKFWRTLFVIVSIWAVLIFVLWLFNV